MLKHGISWGEKAAVAYNLRVAFVRELSWNKKTAETILRGALVAGVLKVIDYMSSSRADMKKVLGLVDGEKAYDDTRGAGALSALQELDVKQIPNLIYTMFADTATEDCAGGYKGAYPKYQPSGKLNGLYAWLLSLGYQMSDEEKALLDGTHKLYHLQESDEKVSAPAAAEADQERK